MPATLQAAKARPTGLLGFVQDWQDQASEIVELGLHVTPESLQENPFSATLYRLLLRGVISNGRYFLEQSEKADSPARGRVSQIKAQLRTLEIDLDASLLTPQDIAQLDKQFLPLFKDAATV